jgi:hypothetical protein
VSINKRKEKATMRRLLMILAIAAAFAVSAGAQAATTIQQFTFDTTFPLCNGDLIHVSGPLLGISSETTTPSGGEVVSFHFQPQNVKGVDLVTGTVFHATGLTRDIVVTSPSGGSTETFVNEFHIQATSGEQSYIVTEIFHITVAPDGTVTVLFDKATATC